MNEGQVPVVRFQPTKQQDRQFNQMLAFFTVVGALSGLGFLFLLLALTGQIGKCTL